MKNTKTKQKERPSPPDINDSMLTKESWKIFQVMAEFVEGYERLVHIKPSVSIYGSARCDTKHPYYKLAQEIGTQLSNSGFSVVTGGGPGIMEAANKGAYSGDSLSIGLNIVLPSEENANKFQDISLRFRHFFTRKVMFVKYAAAYIVLPGGFGTLDELAEILALVQTKKTRQIPIILVKKDYWSGLIEWFKSKLVAEQMIDSEDLDLYQVFDEPDEITKYIETYYKEHPLTPSPQERDMMRDL
jgi:uncharacterized protein (TIGR00730 family)